MTKRRDFTIVQFYQAAKRNDFEILPGFSLCGVGTGFHYPRVENKDGTVNLRKTLGNAIRTKEFYRVKGIGNA